jgi:hypothetical protein
MTVIVIFCSMLLSIFEPKDHYIIEFDLEKYQILDTEANKKAFMNISKNCNPDDTICIAASFKDWSNFEQRKSFSLAVSLQVELEDQLNIHVRLCSGDEVLNGEYPGTFFCSRKLAENKRKILVIR